MSDDVEVQEPALPEGLAEIKPFNGTKIVPVIARACGACKYSAEEKPDLVCRRFPPQVTFLVVPSEVIVGTPNGPRRVMQARAVPHSAFPTMQRDQSCWEFKQKGTG
jgi:hypothetical protein